MSAERDELAEAKAEALESIAAHLDGRRVVWYDGEVGTKIADNPDDPRVFTPLAEWIRAQAEAYRKGIG